MHAWGQLSLLRPCAGVKPSSQQPNVEFKQFEIDIQVEDMQIMFSPKQSDVFAHPNGLVGINWGPFRKFTELETEIERKVRLYIDYKNVK